MIPAKQVDPGDPQPYQVYRACAHVLDVSETVSIRAASLLIAGPSLQDHCRRSRRGSARGQREVN